MSLDTDNSSVSKVFKIGHVLIGFAVALIGLGLFGQSHAAIGYALFLLASLLILSGVFLFSVFALTPWFNSVGLRRTYSIAFWLGGWTYVLAVAALTGYYVFEALSGRIALHYMLFGPAILLAIVILDIGIWRVIVKRNLPTIQRFGNLWQRDNLDQVALRETLVNEVILHKTLFQVSPFRWLRHQLIFWGFGLMFLVELVVVPIREAFPAFGWTDVWHQKNSPLRLGFDIAYDLTGLMVLVGCLMALGYRVVVNGKEAQKYTDTPTTIFLLFVVLTGFFVEGMRLAADPENPDAWASFVGRAFATVTPSGLQAHNVVWIIHALAACGFIAYIPLKRMIHSCATPIGRMLTSQKGLMVEKKARVIKGLAARFGHR